MQIDIVSSRLKLGLRWPRWHWPGRLPAVSPTPPMPRPCVSP